LALAVVLRSAQLLHPGYLTGVTEYDDGVYVGATLRLLHGLLPYRNFVFPEPPGILVLLAPLAALGSLFGQADALAAARVLTALVDVANVALVGRVLQGRGTRARFVGMSLLAIYPASLAAAHTVLLEPYLDFFCLLSAAQLFPPGGASRRGRLLGGLFLGVAGAVKVFAFLPLLAVFYVFLRRRQPLREVIAGTVAGFGLLALPFVVVAPLGFLHDAVIDQLLRHGGQRTAWWYRAADLGGVIFRHTSHSLLLPSLLPVALLLLVIDRRRHSPFDPLESFCGASLILIAAGFAWTTSFFYHYGSFFGPFLAVMFGSCAASLRLPRRASIGLGIIAVVAAFTIVTAEVSSLGSFAGPADSRAVDAAVPPGTCVVGDSPALLLAADRFSTFRHCPTTVDPFASVLAMDADHSTSTTRVGRWWESVLSRSDYAVLDTPWSTQFPLPPSFETFLHRRFMLVARLPGGAGEVYRLLGRPR
jgi:alpha-1,2-mannosyltransferase